MFEYTKIARDPTAATSVIVYDYSFKEQLSDSESDNQLKLFIGNRETWLHFKYVIS